MVVDDPPRPHVVPVIERPITIPHQFEGVVLCEAIEEGRRWFTARLLCPTCKLRISREATAPVRAEKAVIEAVEEHLLLAHAVDGPLSRPKGEAPNGG